MKYFWAVLNLALGTLQFAAGSVFGGLFSLVVAAFLGAEVYLTSLEDSDGNVE